MNLFRLGIPTEVGESVVIERFGCCNCRGPQHICCYCNQPPREIRYEGSGSSWKPNRDCPGQRAKYKVTRIE